MACPKCRGRMLGKGVYRYCVNTCIWCGQHALITWPTWDRCPTCTTSRMGGLVEHPLPRGKPEYEQSAKRTIITLAIEAIDRARLERRYAGRGMGHNGNKNAAHKK